MKKVLTSLSLLVTCYQLSIAQIEVSGQLENYTSSSLLVVKPCGGKFIPFNNKQIPVSERGEFSISLPDTIPGFIIIFTSYDESVRIYAEPGKPDTLLADVKALAQTLQFKGRNREQNRLLNSLKREDEFTGFGNTLTEIALKYDTLPEIIYENVLKMRAKEFDALHREAAEFNFSKSFVEAVNADIHFYHASLFTGICTSEFAPFSYGKASRFDENWGKLWGQMLHLQDISDGKAPVTSWYFRFIYGYVNTYRGWFLDEKLIKKPDWEKGEHIINADTLIRQYFKNESLEYALATNLIYETGQTHFQYPLLDFYEKFRAEYPESEFLPALEKSMKSVYDFFEKQQRPMPEGIFFIENADDIHALRTLYQHFSGKTIFVDVWATWCGPCKREFAYKKELETFLKENDVVPLYISIDKPEREEKWKEMIKYYDLKGYHVRTNEALLADVYNYFGRNGNLSIPRYAIIGKDGLTIQPDAKRPSQGKELIEQIEKSLKN
jgi:thiol-disulfide isomerase/thioredoxin